MAIVETSSYGGIAGKPSYYILVYKGPHQILSVPNRPVIMYKADVWVQARAFAGYLMVLQSQQPDPSEFWARAEAVSPLMNYGAYVTASEDFWVEKGHVTRSGEDVMPHEVIKGFSLVVSDEPIARETEAENYRKKLAAINRMMKSARPGETLTDVLARKYEAERAQLGKERAEHLWKFGDYSPEQARLFTKEEMPPEKAARYRPGGETHLEEFQGERPLQQQEGVWSRFSVELLRRKDDRPNVMASSLAGGHGIGGYDTLDEANRGLQRLWQWILDRNREKSDYAALKENDTRSGVEIRTIATKGRLAYENEPVYLQDNVGKPRLHDEFGVTYRSKLRGVPPTVFTYETRDDAMRGKLFHDQHIDLKRWQLGEVGELTEKGQAAVGIARETDPTSELNVFIGRLRRMARR